MSAERLELVIDDGDSMSKEHIMHVKNIVDGEATFCMDKGPVMGYASFERFSKAFFKAKPGWYRIESETMRVRYGKSGRYYFWQFMLDQQQGFTADEYFHLVSVLGETLAINQVTLINIEYNKWQNAESLDSYKLAGRTTQGLPTKSNGLSYPGEATIIDTDNNPGRKRFYRGYLEMVGAKMWLSDSFFHIIKRDKARVLASLHALEVKTEPMGALTFIDAADHCFTDEDDQDYIAKIRACIFGAP